jgi:hypothetical protein
MRRANGAGQNMAKDPVTIVASMRVSCKDICNKSTEQSSNTSMATSTHTSLSYGNQPFPELETQLIQVLCL